MARRAFPVVRKTRRLSALRAAHHERARHRGCGRRRGKEARCEIEASDERSADRESGSGSGAPASVPDPQVQVLHEAERFWLIRVRTLERNLGSATRARPGRLFGSPEQELRQMNHLAGTILEGPCRMPFYTD